MDPSAQRLVAEHGRPSADSERTRASRSDAPEGRMSEESQVSGGERRRLRRHRNGAAYVTRTRDPIITNFVQRTLRKPANLRYGTIST